MSYKQDDRKLNMGNEPSKAEKLARAMDSVISGGRAFNRQLAAQIRDELRRMDRSALAPAPVPDDVAQMVRALRFYSEEDAWPLRIAAADALEAQAAELARLRADLRIEQINHVAAREWVNKLLTERDQPRAALTHPTGDTGA